jgi:hypothetical protein
VDFIDASGRQSVVANDPGAEFFGYLPDGNGLWKNHLFEFDLQKK